MKLSVLALVILTLIPFTTIKAQDEVEASVGTDVVSSYVWRGQKLATPDSSITMQSCLYLEISIPI